jgi:NAD dependent epimerase/dehydratase family enzyme
VHLADVVRALIFCVDTTAAQGPLNLTAPRPVDNAELSRALGRVLHRPAFLPVPGLALKLLYGEMSELVISGQRAVPKRLRELGFAFEHAEIEPALRDVLDEKPAVA